MICVGCNRRLESGDRFIRDTASGFLGKEADPFVDGLIAEIMSGDGSDVVFCADCTQSGGRYTLEIAP